MQSFVFKFLLEVSSNVSQIVSMTMWWRPTDFKCTRYPFHSIRDKSDSPILV